MKKMLEVLRVLEQLGAEWKARRITRTRIHDTIECVTLVQMDEGVVRSLVTVDRVSGYSRTEAEIVCYLAGRLEEDGVFKHAKHPKDKTAKLFEYQNTVMYRYSKVFGIKLGWRPVGTVPAEHQFLTDFADRLIAEADVAQKATADEAKVVAEERRGEKTRKRLDGPCSGEQGFLILSVTEVDNVWVV
ncbi:MAG: hypothetical protein HYX22_01355 [Candidatus Yanofskybacteria bacterium]|nr:hypothetical protein [Candidatus Yanofskybacteria bacterium]